MRRAVIGASRLAPGRRSVQGTKPANPSAGSRASTGWTTATSGRQPSARDGTGRPRRLRLRHRRVRARSPRCLLAHGLFAGTIMCLPRHGPPYARGTRPANPPALSRAAMGWTRATSIRRPSVTDGPGRPRPLRPHRERRPDPACWRTPVGSTLATLRIGRVEAGHRRYSRVRPPRPTCLRCLVPHALTGALGSAAPDRLRRQRAR